jgi:SAM-dependent methyltransferase
VRHVVTLEGDQMDLKEIKNIHVDRHPWETTRLNALKNILSPELFEGIMVLDVGCGDGFISRNLFDHLQRKDVTAVDINLSDEWILELGKLSQGIRYQREMPSEGKYDLVMLLDVIEHIEFDIAFLVGTGKVLITVPAFQSIYGRHDAFLGHFRRYSQKELVSLATSCGLRVISSGYLFFSLLLPKLVLYKLLDIGNASEGAGNWKRGKVMTSVIEKILNFDNRLLISASGLGIKIPGLTGWVLCEKRG